MSKEVFYRQCDLERGSGRTCGFIEERGAIVGKYVELISDNNSLWLITQVGDKRFSEKFIRERYKTNIFGSIN